MYPVGNASSKDTAVRIASKVVSASDAATTFVSERNSTQDVSVRNSSNDVAASIACVCQECINK
jgi:uncharacterized Rossmann fold enzyme